VITVGFTSFGAARHPGSEAELVSPGLSCSEVGGHIGTFVGWRVSRGCGWSRTWLHLPVREQRCAGSALGQPVAQHDALNGGVASALGDPAGGPPVMSMASSCSAAAVCRAKTRCEILTRCFSECLGCAPILVDQSAEDLVTLDRGVAGDDGGGIVSGWMLAQALVRPVIIEMADVLIKNSVSVSCVVNQHSVGAFGADAADEPFRVAVRLGCAGRDLDHGDCGCRIGHPRHAAWAYSCINPPSRSRRRR
jgi:hypothetical protein